VPLAWSWGRRLYLKDLLGVDVVAGGEAAFAARPHVRSNESYRQKCAICTLMSSVLLLPVVEVMLCLPLQTLHVLCDRGECEDNADKAGG